MQFSISVNLYQHLRMQEEVEQADITDSVVVGVWRYVVTDDYDFSEAVVDFQESVIGKDKCSEIGKQGYSKNGNSSN